MRGGVRASDAQPATAGSTRTDALIARQIIWSCDAVLDGRLDALESSAVVALRTFERFCVAARRCRFRNPGLRGRIFAGRSGADQQPDHEMDDGITSRRLASAGASLGSVPLAENVWTDCSVRNACPQRS